MNPFDWRGPQFLVFYIVLMIVVAAVVRRLRTRRERAQTGYRGTPIHDPYAIAFLRGGKHELVRVAIVSMVDRGLLLARNDQVATTEVGRGTSVRRRIEKDLLAFCVTPRKAAELFADETFDVAGAEIEFELAQMGLMPDDETAAARRKLFFTGAALLLVVSLVKIAVALARGRTNLGLLILFTVVGLGLTWRAAVVGRTPRGEAFLKELENLFRSLRLRAKELRPGGATSEVAMLAAVWGITALPPERFGWSDELFRKAATSGGGGSCGSSCGSGCGGGCGGGGCGGCGG
jgi:uncharacterized protein (TIGR04222 family)